MKIISRMLLVLSIVLLSHLEISCNPWGIYYFEHNVTQFIIIIFLLAALIIEIFSFVLQRRKRLPLIKSIIGFIILCFLLLVFYFLILSFPGAGHCGPSKDTRIIRAISQARTIMLYLKQEDGNYDNFNCRQNDMKLLCDEIDRYAPYRAKKWPVFGLERKYRKDGKEPIITHDTLINSQEACIFSPLNWQGRWYCADSKGQADYTEINPGTNSYCGEGKSAICPSEKEVEAIKKEEEIFPINCEELLKNFDAKIGSIGPSECDKWMAEGEKPIWVGGKLIEISKTYNSAYERNEFTLIFQGFRKQGRISIDTKRDSIPYKIGKFYKFDLGKKCELIYSMASSGMFPDPDLNALEHLDECEDKTTDWKTYRNDEYGFEFKYPKDWSIEDLSGTKDILVYIDLRPQKNTNCGCGLDRFFIGVDKKSIQEHRTTLGYTIIKTEEETEIDGKKGIKQIRKHNGEIIFIFFPIDSNKTLQINFGDDCDEDNEDICDRIMNQILSTFRFLE